MAQTVLQDMLKELLYRIELGVRCDIRPQQQ